MESLMKDYYEILEVNKKASKEVIDKAYKVPDLQQWDKKSIAQKKMQEVNEAYEVLSDENKRREYDESLELEEKRKLEELIKKQNSDINKENKQYEDNVDGNYNYNDNKYINPFSKKSIKEQEKRQIQQRKKIIEEDERRYRNYLRSMGYRIKERWTWKRFFNLLKVIAIFCIIILILWIIPPTRKLMIDTYEQNPVIQTIVKIIVNVFIGMFKGIVAFFKQIFNIK